MEQLEKLKDVWKSQSESTIKFTKSDIYNMVHKRSSSIVKWILIISILEFALPNLFMFFTNFESTKEVYQNYGLNNIMLFYAITHILFILGFIYIFYTNYKNINAERSVKSLLHNILKTRNTVKYYIYYNLTMASIIGIHVFYIVFNSELFTEKLPANTSMIMIWFIAIGTFAFFLFLFWVFYRIVYGFFLKKLKNNYTELQRNE
ncbi:MAG: hypothetical protein KAT78_02915 [Flavobacteriaceae bacterium]|nr:hypothetical protein [Flavobacteriaceae bacterium]